jgi:hypothetical protein
VGQESKAIRRPRIIPPPDAFRRKLPFEIEEVVMRSLTLIAVSLLVVASCGDGDGGSPAAPTPTPAPVPQVIQQGGFSLPAPVGDEGFFGLVEVRTSAAGTWEATVDWTFPTNTLFMYVATGSCTVEQFSSDACPESAACACQFATRSELAAPKPRILTVPNAAAGTRTLIVWNLGPREESGTYTIRLTPSTLATSASDAATQVYGVSGLSVAPKARRR